MRVRVTRARAHDHRPTRARGSAWPTRRVRFVSSLLGAFLIGATTAGCSLTSPGEGPSAASTPVVTGPAAPASPTDQGASDSGDLADVPGVAAKVQPSVVTVTVDGGSGSGVVYREDGLIITNEHVVRGNVDVQISFADGQQVAGTVKATDAVTDIALVQAERTGLPPVKFQTELPRVGSLAVVLGALPRTTPSTVM